MFSCIMRNLFFPKQPGILIYKLLILTYVTLVINYRLKFVVTEILQGQTISNKPHVHSSHVVFQMMQNLIVSKLYKKL